VEATTRFFAGIVSANLRIVTIGDTTRLAGAISANIAIGAGQSVIAHQGIVREDATDIRCTGVVRTKLPIRADNGYPSLASPLQALFIGGTLVTIVAGNLVVHVQAADFKITVVIGAEIIIVAGSRFPRLALASGTGIILGASVRVVARIDIGSK